jgi:iron-sulfur cluster assembly accessory protein
MKDFNLFITEKAKNYFLKKIDSQHILKIDLKKSGCSGYSIEFKIIPVEDNTYDIFNSIKVLVNPEHQEKLTDTVIDLKQEGLNNKIVFDNPKAVQHCGCGESFNIKENK